MDFGEFLKEKQLNEVSKDMKLSKREDYVLKDKKTGKYVGTKGKFPSSHNMEKSKWEGKVWSGNSLLSQSYDWEMRYKAEKISGHEEEYDSTL